MIIADGQVKILKNTWFHTGPPFFRFLYILSGTLCDAFREDSGREMLNITDDEVNGPTYYDLKGKDYVWEDGPNYFK